jgi:hypothetical protein
MPMAAIEPGASVHAATMVLGGRCFRKPQRQAEAADDNFDSLNN